MAASEATKFDFRDVKEYKFITPIKNKIVF